MMSFNEKNIQRMVQYFEEGCKDKEHLRIGVEVEHFVLSGDGTPITYEQLIKVMKQAMKEHIKKDCKKAINECCNI